MQGETNLNAGEAEQPQPPLEIDIRHILKEMGIQAECLRDDL